MDTLASDITSLVIIGDVLVQLLIEKIVNEINAGKSMVSRRTRRVD